MWAKVSPCAEQIAVPEGSEQAQAGSVFVEVLLTTRYSPLTSAWLVDASNTEPAITFGVWEVNDVFGSVTPLDDVARSIVTPGITCSLPIATLATTLTPPIFIMPGPPPAPTATPTPVPLVTSADAAALRVWISVYNCYSHFPESDSFTGTQESPVSWTVEGKSDITHYGLWEVAAITGAITPRDDLAIQAQRQCASREQLPAMVSGTQASLRVWIALYDCFPLSVVGESDVPIPPDDFFTTFQESPERWIVEGKGETERQVEITVTEQGASETFTEGATPTTYYGLWVVDTSSGRIAARDQAARDIIALGCFNPL